MRVFLCIFFFFSSGCAFVVDYSAAGKHQAFLRIYSTEVGLNVSQSRLHRYPMMVVSRGSLASKYELYEFKTFRGDKCRIFYIVDLSKAMVTGWYFEGSEKDRYRNI